MTQALPEPFSNQQLLGAFACSDDDDGNGKIDDIRGWDFVNVSPSQGWPGQDVVGEDNDPMDFGGHGTLVSGCIAPLTNNGVGIAGVAGGIGTFAQAEEILRREQADIVAAARQTTLVGRLLPTLARMQAARWHCSRFPRRWQDLPAWRDRLDQVAGPPTSPPRGRD